MEITLRDIYLELQNLRKELSEFRVSSIITVAKVDALEARIEKIEAEITGIKGALVGNVTAKSMKQWIIGAAAVMCALLSLLGMLQKLL